MAISAGKKNLLAADKNVVIGNVSHKHRGQRRKDTGDTPYVNHVIGVAHTLATVGGITDMVTLVAAVLHDTLEDTETTSAELEDRFGTDVCHLRSLFLRLR